MWRRFWSSVHQPWSDNYKTTKHINGWSTIREHSIMALTTEDSTNTNINILAVQQCTPIHHHSTIGGIPSCHSNQPNTSNMEEFNKHRILQNVARAYQRKCAKTLKIIPGNSKRTFRPNTNTCDIKKHEAIKQLRSRERADYEPRVCICATNREYLLWSNRKIQVHIHHGTSKFIDFICIWCQCHFSGTYQKLVIGRN